MMAKLCGLIAVLLILCGSATGQNTWIVLEGKIIDIQTSQPLPFASVRVHRKNTGTLSNAEGIFLFKIPAAQESDSLEISFVGYLSSVIPIASLTGKIRTIALVPAVKTLDEVVIRAKTGEDVIREFIAHIPDNYDTTRKKLQAFYREEINLGTDPISFNESVIDIYKAAYPKTADQDQMKVLKGRHRPVDWKGDPMRGWMSGLANGAGNSVREDMAKNYNAPNSPLSPANFKYYEYNIESIINQGNKSLYVISFKPRKKAPRSKLTLNGMLYINTSSMAMEKIQFALSERGVVYLNHHRGFGYRIMTVAYQVSLHWTDAHEVITWSEVNGKWHLREVQRNLTATVNSPKRKMKGTIWNAKSVLVVTAIDSGVAKPLDPKENIMNSTMSMGRLINGKDQDKEFWEHYNIVQAAYVDTDTSTHTKTDTLPKPKASNRKNGFTRADTLHGKLTVLRTCYDVTFYHLDVRVDPENKFIGGSSLIRYKAVAPFTKLQIDLYANMKIEKILWQGKTLNYSREFGAVYVEFPQEQLQGSVGELKAFYSGRPQEPSRDISMNGGFFWDKDKNGKPWVQVVCQGSGSSLWWPNKDHLSDKPDSARITVTVPSGLTDISNGRLRSKTELPGDMTKYDWYVSYPINNYNITMNIGDYQHRRDFMVRKNDTLTLDYYYMNDSEAKADMIFKRVKPMLKVYENKFGPYPFPRDGFTLMESNYPMEHQSAVSIGKFVGDKTDTVEMEEITRLMHHEVAHEWWGNSVSIKDYADFWVHEAFATYAEAIMIESKYGYDASAEYLNQQATENKEPIIGEYGVNHIFYNLGDIYNKGALMINTLRHVIHNDSLWFDILRGIQKQFKYQTVTTGEIENYISQKSKMDLGYFFDQYLRTTQIPKLVTELEQKGANTQLRYRWENVIKDFRMPVKVIISKGKYDFIYPTDEWKTTTLKNLQEEDFEIKQNDFLITW